MTLALLTLQAFAARLSTSPRCALRIALRHGAAVNLRDGQAGRAQWRVRADLLDKLLRPKAVPDAARAMRIRVLEFKLRRVAGE